eukprot:CAMPEP_0118678080 /NCGR_PEP_ID=MMETSP0800-20121206/3000_1 /TAXON_ID=210618 ORGANISM="Striatella unipunctata, Strain CCMP2910" /NCGR_SAMPLE_ID=MMETSP0800 /ASSEMBLY_ACC=CAM_ASM_000638 /LENGTH=424 /DNA_ID=CAMNT_0006573857 /DNA_START=90 /DNA_END=1361 /DNA_ORIENTATION=-
MGRCPNCKQCPVCESVLAISELSAEGNNVTLHYKCGYCTWSSDESGIVATLRKESKDAAQVASDELKKLVDSKLKEMERETEELFTNMVRVWGEKAKEAERRKRLGDILHVGRKKTATPEAWSIEALELSLKKKKEDAVKDASTSVGGLQVHEIEEEPMFSPDPRVDPWKGDVLTSGLSSSNLLLPLGIPLRPKKSRRCRAELAQGRPGILIKPKLNPLEGDSSLRTNHGQWFKKDSGAIHVIPKVQIVRYEKNEENKMAFLLLVQNPTLGLLRFRFNKSEYKFTGLEGKGLILDFMNHERVDAVSGPLDIPLSPDIYELDSVEDAFLELGKSQNNTPKPVEDWNGAEVLSSAGDKPSMKFLSKEKDKAWFELTAPVDALGEDEAEDTRRAVSLQLQIEVGNGSWETSLVQAKTNVEKDFVSFD